MNNTGKVFLVGAGPGDPGLITVRGVECIAAADVVVYDYLANPALLRYAREGAEVIYVGKSAGKHTLSQEGINALLVEKAKAGKVVTRLKGGDPYVFGRGGEEAEELAKAGIPFEVVPGISSAIAAPSYAGIPVTHRAVATAFMVVTGHEDPTKAETQVNWESVAKFFGTRVILMGVERIGEISDQLIKHGAARDLPVAMIRWGTTGQQRTITGTLATIAQVAQKAELKPPAITIIGEVVKLRATLNWFEKRPLFGKRVVVTRTRTQASELSRQLTDLGAEVLEIPTIAIKPPKSLAPLREGIASIGTYDWLVFTSPNGVDGFFNEFFTTHPDLRDLGGLRIAAVGPATAQKLAALHLTVDLQPKEFTAEALLKAFKEEVSVENLKFLMPIADIADKKLARGLEDLGAMVDDLDAYQTVPDTEDRNGHRARLQDDGADFITFTSSSTVNNFCELMDVAALRKKHRRLQFISIGPQTTATLKARKLPVAAEAAEHTIDGLVATLCELAARH